MKTSYDQEVYIKGLGVKKCIVYELIPKEYPKALVVIFYDKEIGWPLKVRYIWGADEIELTIIESNIPDLRK